MRRLIFAQGFKISLHILIITLCIRVDKIQANNLLTLPFLSSTIIVGFVWWMLNFILNKIMFTDILHLVKYFLSGVIELIV